jgi:hypothetical protein
MNFRRASLIAASTFVLSLACGTFSSVHAARPLVLKYSAEEGLAGRQARGATFKAWIDGGRPVTGTTDEIGRVTLNMGRPLSKGQTLFVEAQSADGERFYSWVFRDAALDGEVGSSCQLVGVQDFRAADVRTAQRVD